jgi:hypothetical protein
MEPTATRVSREQAHYDAGLKRDTYTKVFAGSPLKTEHLQYANGRRILELGSHSWIRWIEEAGIRPRELE